MSEGETTTVRRAPHMERYTNIHPYRTEERRDGCQVTLTIGVQSFILSDGSENHHESRAAAEWSRRQLCLALDTLRSEVIEECAAHLEQAGSLPCWKNAADRIRTLKGDVK